MAPVPLRVQQFTFHPKNANQVWPGTFGLADFLLSHEDRCALTNGRRRAPHRAAKARGRVGGEEPSDRPSVLPRGPSHCPFLSGARGGINTSDTSDISLPVYALLRAISYTPSPYTASCVSASTEKSPRALTPDPTHHATPPPDIPNRARLARPSIGRRYRPAATWLELGSATGALAAWPRDPSNPKTVVRSPQRRGALAPITLRGWPGAGVTSDYDARGPFSR